MDKSEWAESPEAEAMRDKGDEMSLKSDIIGLSELLKCMSADAPPMDGENRKSAMIWAAENNLLSILPEADRFTVVFEGDLRKIKVNPFLVDTPFGRPVSIGVGDALGAIDYSDDQT